MWRSSSQKKNSKSCLLRISRSKNGLQVEAEFARVHARLDEKFAEISATTSSSREVAAACANQVANFDIILRQFVENNSGRVASRDDGDAQGRQRQKAQLATEMATWNKVNTARKLCIIRGRIPPNLGDF